MTPECLTVYNGTLLMALRLTFGGSSCPALWGYISNKIIDTCNTLLQNQHWNHEELYKSISNTIDTTGSLPKEIPFGTANELMVDIPINHTGFTDIYIDDSTRTALDIMDNPIHINRAILLTTSNSYHRRGSTQNRWKKILADSIIQLPFF